MNNIRKHWNAEDVERFAESRLDCNIPRARGWAEYNWEGELVDVCPRFLTRTPYKHWAEFMQWMRESVVVVFRRWPNGVVLALFPYLPGDGRPGTCLSYEHIGQHGAADYWHCIQSTTPAPLEAYAPLLRELQGPLDYKLRIRTRATLRKLGQHE